MEIEEGLRNRVVGAIIITVLAAIFLPMLLNNPKQDDGQQISEKLDIPQKPLDSPSLTATILPDNADDVLKEPVTKQVVTDNQPSETAVEIVKETKLEVVTTAQTPQATAIENKAVNSHQLTTTTPNTVSNPQKLQPPRLDSPSVKTKQAGRWFVQVASFSEQKNVISFRDKLRNQGFSATIDSVWTKKGRIYKLRVGPELDRQRAERIRNQLNRLNNVKSIIVSN